MPHSIRGRVALPGAEQRAQHNRTRDHGRAFRNLMVSDVGRSRQRLLGWPVARRAGFSSCASS